GRGDRPGRAAVLDRGIAPNDRASPAAPLEAGEEVTTRGARLSGDHADATRQRGTRQQLLSLEQALLGEPAAQALEPGQQVALARQPELLHAEGEAGGGRRAAHVEVAAAASYDLHAVAEVGLGEAAALEVVAPHGARQRA